MFKKAGIDDKKAIRAIAKKHGVLGCCQPLHAVHVGKQCVQIDKSVVNALVADLQNNGFIVEESASNSIVDVILVWRAA